MRLRSLSNSITVDLMATKKIEDTDNLTGHATDVVSCNCVFYIDNFKLELHQKNAPLFALKKETTVDVWWVTRSLQWICTFYHCFVVQPLQLHCVDMSWVINYSCVCLSLTVKRAVSTVSERLSLLPAGWKYEEKLWCSKVPLFRLLTYTIYQCTFRCFFFLTSSFVRHVSFLNCYVRLLTRKWNSRALYLIHIFTKLIVRFLQKSFCPLQDTNNIKLLGFFFNVAIKCHRVIQLTTPIHLPPVSTQVLTMHFEGQRLWELVFSSHIFTVGHTAIGPLIVTPCMRDRQEETVFNLLDSHWIVAPRSLPNRTPGLHVLLKKERKKERKSITMVMADVHLNAYF